MANLALCPVSAKRLVVLRAQPALARDLRAAIRAGEVPDAIFVGRWGPVRDRSKPDLVGGAWSALTRRERLEARFDAFGPRAWERAREILDGDVGDALRTYARIVAPLVVARAAAAMKKPLPPAPERSVEAVADAVRALIVATAASGDHLLALGPARARRKARSGD
jgi:hypothetical protein